MNRACLSIAASMLFVLAAKGYPAATGVDFLKFSIGARSAGMGESGVALCSDPTASYWNPAGLARVQRPAISAMHSEAIVDATLAFAGFAYPFSKYGTLCVSGIFYIIDPIPVTLGSGATLGDLKWTDQAFLVSCGMQVTDALSLGAGGKLIQRKESDPLFGKSEGTAWAMDLGAVYKTPVKGLSLGCALLNSGNGLQMSGETRKDALPQTTRAGAAYEYPIDESMALVLTGDCHKVRSGKWYAGGGAEICLQGMVFLRTGYYRKEGNVMGATYGFGLKLKQLQIDYSNVPVSEMVGYTRNNKVSMTIVF